MEADREQDSDDEFLSDLFSSFSARRSTAPTALTAQPKVRSAPSAAAVQPLAESLPSASSTYEDLSPHERTPSLQALQLILPSCASTSLIQPEKTCGAILTHAIEQTEWFRKQLGGALCVLKIGITHDAASRWQLYSQANFSHMHIVHVSMSLSQVEMLEAALISHFKRIMRDACRNQARGGEGMRIRGKPRHPPPYLVYIVGARADQRARIGS